MKGVTWALILTAGVLMSCGASPEAINAYHEAVRRNNELLLRHMEMQHEERRATRVDMMLAYNEAVAAAAKTVDITDDVLIAFAYGYQVGHPSEIQVPMLQKVEPPESGIDAIKAWTPIISLFTALVPPFLNAYFLQDGGSNKNVYEASSGGSIYVESGNTGSYNRASGDQYVDNMAYSIPLAPDTEQ